uniref:Calponin-homology (CH) domain-containing protein n=1 Tax=Panagrolaimus sp. ES5 TaxID=591445 RepID=A0AC34F1C5_9BILA
MRAKKKFIMVSTTENIVDGKKTVILTLFENIILNFEVDNIKIGEKRGRLALLEWCQSKTDGYQNIFVSNFTTSWTSGLALNAIIHTHCPYLVDFNKLKVYQHVKNLNNALELAEMNFGIPKLIKAEEIDVANPDSTSIITYLSQLYHYFEKNKDLYSKFNDKKIDANSKVSQTTPAKINKLPKVLQNIPKEIIIASSSANQILPKTNDKLNTKQKTVITELNMIFKNWLKNMDEIPTYSIPKKLNSYDTNINAVGIDLGTSSCFAAVNRKNAIETVALDNIGERTLPSYIGFEEKKVKCGKLVVERMGHFAKYTVFDSKRLIGQSFDKKLKDPTWPFQIIDKNGKLLIQHLDCDKNTVTKSPEEVASKLLLHIKQKVREFQGKEPTTTVITIPAAFTESQKEATLEAAKLAGFEKVNLLPEPVAASFAYFIDRPLPNNATILLFDLGGGTLDICIFKINNSQMQIISNTGDPNIGGRDFDKVLFDYFNAELISKFNLNIENQEERKKYKLLLECQKIKHSLTIRHDEWLDIEDFNTSLEGVINLTRKDFEAKTSKLTERMKKLIVRALTEAKCQSYEIKNVFRVGGSSRMPIVSDMLKKMFPNAEHRAEQNPDEVVALGAAYYSYHLATEKNY